ncbi:MAG: hypothetical protein AUH85_09895 [Chloroflexi bacterium 13_1_40CM_4_68_4]|nr:MAG: hypothetical protein AUH85_09895 [Chloroflexi bacterium 13_1_40CM_4_68_4]
MGEVRRSLGKVLALALVLGSVLANATPAAAGANWCEGDPVFSVGGNVIDVTTTFATGYASLVSGPLNFELLVPSNAILPLVVSLGGSVPIRGSVSRSLPPYYGLFSMPVVLRVSMNASQSFPTYTRITGVTKLGWSVTLLNTVTGTSTSVQQYRFYLPLL